MPNVTIYTDGACLQNPGGNGGWAAILISGKHKKVISGNCRHTTNNRMELRAALEGLRALKQPCTVKLITDSKYLQQGLTYWLHNWQERNWRTSMDEPVQNQDLWQEINQLRQQHNVTAFWTKGHAGHALNEEADATAANAASAVTDATPVDPGGRPPKPRTPRSRHDPRADDWGEAYPSDADDIPY